MKTSNPEHFLHGFFGIVALLLSTGGQGFGGDPGSILWQYDFGSQIGPSPAVAPDGTVYIGAGGGFFAITNNGAVASNRWTFPSGISGSPAIGRDGTIYFANGSGLYALETNGLQKWLYPAGNGSPAIGPDNSIYVVDSGLLYGITAEGTKKWHYTIDDPSTGYALSPVVGSDGTIYVGSHFNGTFYAVNPDGTKRWSISTVGWAGESAAIGQDGTIYFTGGPLRALTSAGSLLWSNGTNDFSGASPMIGQDGTIYVASYPAKTLYAFTPSGQPSWNVLYENYAFGPPPPTTAATGAGGTLYYCASNSVFALSRQGQVQWQITKPGSPGAGVYWATTSPVIGPDGTLYAALGTTLYAIATGTNGPANSPWPMYRQNARHTGKVEKPVLKQPKKRADANFEFQLYPQELGLTYTIDSSTNLNTWTSLTSFVAITFPTEVVDLTASNAPFRFYRASSPP